MMVRNERADALPLNDGFGQIPGELEKFGEVLVQAMVVWRALQRLQVNLASLKAGGIVHSFAQLANLQANFAGALLMVELGREGRLTESLENILQDGSSIPIGQRQVVLANLLRRPIGCEAMILCALAWERRRLGGLPRSKLRTGRRDGGAPRPVLNVKVLDP